MTKHARTLEEADHVERIHHVPTAKEVLNWQREDTLSYESTGGIVAFAGAGFGPIGIGAAKVQESTFKTYIEREEGTRALVKISDMKERVKSEFLGVGFVSVGKSQTEESNSKEENGLDSIMSFSIDLKTDDGQKAYSDLVNGNVAAIQKMATERHPSVRFQEKATLTQVGRFNNAFIGIPILLNETWSSGNIYEVSSVQDITAKTKMNAKYGIYMKEVKTRALNRHSTELESFYGAATTVAKRNSKQAPTKEKFGQYVLAMENDHAEPYKLSSAMKAITAKTGLNQVAMFNVPSFDDLGYMKVEMKVTMETAQTENIMRKISQLRTPEALSNVAASVINEYFTTHDRDDHNACNKYAGTVNAVCENEVTKETMLAVKDMHRAAIKMASVQQDDKAFVKAYADFGQAMLKNQFTFQTALRLAGPGVNVAYKIESTSFSKVQYEFVTTENPLVLTPVASAQNDEDAKNNVDTSASENRGVLLNKGRPHVLVPAQR